MPTTTPPEVAPICWCLGGPWHGRRILHPGRTTAFEVVLIAAPGLWTIQTYVWVEPGALALKGFPPLFAEGWEAQAQRDGFWKNEGHRRGLGEVELRYLYPGGPDVR